MFMHASRSQPLQAIVPFLNFVGKKPVKKAMLRAILRTNKFLKFPIMLFQRYSRAIVR